MWSFCRRISGICPCSPTTIKPCGSWLASDGVGSANTNARCAGLIAGKPAPTSYAFNSARDWRPDARVQKP
ncbi:hypothetical protein C1893_16505 [Pseudomonas sp. MPR-ANC1]|nr:hypothetical protein C1893_16505 [Pseudomonas sp. MPR-ANC1]